MKVLDQDQHSVCKVEGHHSHDGFDNNPNMLCLEPPSCEVAHALPPSPRKDKLLSAWHSVLTDSLFGMRKTKLLGDLVHLPISKNIGQNMTGVPGIALIERSDLIPEASRDQLGELFWVLRRP